MLFVTKGSHDPISGKYFFLLIVAWIKFLSPGFNPSRPWVIYWYKIESSYHNADSGQIYSCISIPLASDKDLDPKKLDLIVTGAYICKIEIVYYNYD